VFLVSFVVNAVVARHRIRCDQGLRANAGKYVNGALEMADADFFGVGQRLAHLERRRSAFLLQAGGFLSPTEGPRQPRFLRSLSRAPPLGKGRARFRQVTVISRGNILKSHQIPAPRRGALPLAQIAAFALACAPSFARADSVLAPVGPVGRGDTLILLDALAIMLAIVVPTMIATLVCAWWFRASNTRATYRPDFTYSGRIELIVWSIPLLTIFFLGGVIWIGSHRLDPFQPLPSTVKPLEVDAVAFDWKWLFIYPGQRVASVNRLIVPVGRPLHFRITSASVFNVFFVPRLGSMIYAMNGMVSQLNLQADRPGTYLGLSAQFSGDGFSDMGFETLAVPPAQFTRWAASVEGAALDRAAAAGLLKQSRAVAPYVYRGVDPTLFDAIASRTLGPGEGPQSGRDGPGTQNVTPHRGAR
jgi:cytochrome o ubiquinol oxidase subunit II